MDDNKIIELISMGELDSAHKLIEVREEKSKCRLLNKLSEQYESLGEFQKSLVFAEKVIFEASKNNYQIELLNGLINKSIANMRLFNYVQVNKTLKEGINLVNEIPERFHDRDFFMARSSLLNVQGLYHRYQGKLTEALNLFENSLEIRYRLNDQRQVGISLANISTVYQLKGEVNKALENNLEAMQIFMHSNEDSLFAVSLHEIGVAYRKKGDLLLAENFYLKAIELRRKLTNVDHLAETLYELIQLTLEMNKFNAADEYFFELLDLSEINSSKIFQQRLLLSEASIIKSSNRFSATAKAQQIFGKIANETILNHDLTVFALLSLLELHLFEYKLIKNKIILSEINTMSLNLLDIAKNQNSFLLLTQVYILLYRLAVMELDLEKAQVLLSQAELTAKEHQLERLMALIEDEQKSFNEKLKRYNEYLEENLTFIEAIEEANLQDSLDLLIKRSNLESTVLLSSDKPVFILLLNADGISLYSYSFDKSITINKALIGGFLMASDLGISNAIKDQDGSFESIKYGRYTLIFRKVEEITCCYAFIGPPHKATQRLSQFLEITHTEKDIWDLLNKKLIRPKKIASFLDPVIKLLFATEEVMEEDTTYV